MIQFYVSHIISLGTDYIVWELKINWTALNRKIFYWLIMFLIWSLGRINFFKKKNRTKISLKPYALHGNVWFIKLGLFTRPYNSWKWNKNISTTDLWSHFIVIYCINLNITTKEDLFLYRTGFCLHAKTTYISTT